MEEYTSQKHYKKASQQLGAKVSLPLRWWIEEVWVVMLGRAVPDRHGDLGRHPDPAVDEGTVCAEVSPNRMLLKELRLIENAQRGAIQGRQRRQWNKMRTGVRRGTGTRLRRRKREKTRKEVWISVPTHPSVDVFIRLPPGPPVRFPNPGYLRHWRPVTIKPIYPAKKVCFYLYSVYFVDVWTCGEFSVATLNRHSSRN
jgi:hypothetical protein